MKGAEFLQVLACGEDSRHQFKRDASSSTVFLGVADDGSAVGLDAATVQRLSQLLRNDASQQARVRCICSPRFAFTRSI